MCNYKELGGSWEKAALKKNKSVLVEELRTTQNKLTEIRTGLPTRVFLKSMSIALPGLSPFSLEILNNGYKKGIETVLDLFD